MADAPLDIFTTLHKAVWAALNASATFTDLVKLNNRIDVTADDFTDFVENLSAEATPEVVILQSAFSQQRFGVSDPAANRSQSFRVIVTGGSLKPIEVNQVKEAALDALLDVGPNLGIKGAVNGNKVLGWSVGGSEDLTADNPARGNSDQRSRQLRVQALMDVTVAFKKVIQSRPVSA